MSAAIWAPEGATPLHRVLHQVLRRPRLHLPHLLVDAEALQHGTQR